MGTLSLSFKALQLIAAASCVHCFLTNSSEGHGPQNQQYFHQNSLRGVRITENGEQIFKQIRARNSTKSLVCFCTSPKQLNVLPVDPMANRTDASDLGREHNKSFKIFQCAKNKLVCTKWNPPFKINSICYYINKNINKNKNKEDNAIHAKEVQSNSCVLFVNTNILGQPESRPNNGTRNENTLHEVLTIKNQLPDSTLLNYDGKLFHVSKHMLTWFLAAKKRFSKTRQDETFENSFRKRRSSTINLKPMIFPHLSRNILERKRSTHFANERNKMALPTTSIKEDGISAKTHQEDQYRKKREMHVMLARYRSKENKRSSRKKRPKTTARPNHFDENDNCDRGVSTTPFTFLNVSFTGYWERKETTTTVRPRIQKPLKMTEKDLEFVYGKSGTESKKPSKGKSGGWSSKLEVTF